MWKERQSTGHSTLQWCQPAEQEVATNLGTKTGRTWWWGWLWDIRLAVGTIKKSSIANAPLGMVCKKRERHQRHLGSVAHLSIAAVPSYLLRWRQEPRGHGRQAGPCCGAVLRAQGPAQGSAMVGKLCLCVCLHVTSMAVGNSAAERQTVTNYILVNLVIISNAFPF